MKEKKSKYQQFWRIFFLTLIPLIGILRPAAEYPYQVISNCLCYDTNTAGKVIHDLRDYQLVKKQNILFSEMVRTNEIIYSNLTVYITNEQRDQAQTEKQKILDKLGGGLVGAGIGLFVGFISGMIIGR